MKALGFWSVPRILAKPGSRGNISPPHQPNAHASLGWPHCGQSRRTMMLFARASSPQSIQWTMARSCAFLKRDKFGNGQFRINLIEGRPSKNNFGGSQKLQDFARATNVRMRLLRPKTLQGHLMDLHGNQDQTPDVTVTRRVRGKWGKWKWATDLRTFSTTMASRKSSWSANAFAMAIPSIVICRAIRTGHGFGFVVVR